MRYRIKITMYKDGHRDYLAQKRVGLWWSGISYEGEVSIVFNSPSETREGALRKIDKNFSGATKVQKIEFEYINK